MADKGGILKGAASGAAAGAALGPWGAAIGGAIGAGIGVIDRVKGNSKLKESEDFYAKNKFQLPESLKASLQSAERQAQGFRLPGEDIRRTEIAEATAGGLGAAQNAATSASDVLSVLSGLYGSQQAQERGMAVEGAERFDRNQAMLRDELGRMAQAEDEKWQYDVFLPYQQMLGQAEAYSERGGAGIGAGLGTIGEAAGAYSQLASSEEQYNQFLNRMGLGNTSPYAGMDNQQRVQMMAAQQQLGKTRQGLYGLDNINTPQTRF